MDYTGISSPRPSENLQIGKKEISPQQTNAGNDIREDICASTNAVTTPRDESSPPIGNTEAKNDSQVNIKKIAIAGTFRKYLKLEIVSENQIEITKINKRGEEIKKVYTGGKNIGDGGFGEVYRIESTDGGKAKALKMFYELDSSIAPDTIEKGKEITDKQFINPDTGEALRNIPGMLNLKYLDSSYGVSRLCTGDMDSVAEGKPRSFAFACGYISQTAFAVNHLHVQSQHKPGLVHWDIKPCNILYQEDGDNSKFYIIDFDGAHAIDDMNDSTINGPMNYKDWKAPPSEKRNSAIDVRALAFAWESHFSGNKFIMGNIEMKDVKLDLSELNSEEKIQLQGILDLINHMKIEDYTKRPTMEECVTALKELGLELPTYDEKKAA